MDNSMKIGLVKVTLFSILLALSGMAAIASADFVTPIMFYGNATLNDESATTGMVINAYIDDKPSGTYTITVDGQYHINVRGNESDEGELITFEICGATADQTDMWHASANSETRLLDLTAWDTEAPAVENANATPSSIVADGAETTLNVTVIDGCGVGDVTVNLSAIGRSDVQTMTCIEGTDVYSVTVNATEGTALGAHCLQVNASDVFGNYNDSVWIGMTVEAAYAKGDFNGNDVIDIGDVAKIANLQLGNIPTTQDDLNIGDFNSNGVIDIGDVAKLANYQLGNIDEL